MAGFLDLIHDAAIAGAESRVLTGIADQLDPRAHAHARSNASQKMSCALCVHGRSIGSPEGRSIPHWYRFSNPFGQEERSRIRRSRRGRRTVPNSTA
jgi:hypothetical protein